jgi:hypothetical protein
MRSVCIVEINVTVNNVKVQNVEEKCFYGESFFANSSKMRVDLYAKWPTFLSDINQIRNLFIYLFIL